MQIGDILIDSQNTVYLVKAFMPKDPKRVLLLDPSDGMTFSILKSIARHWLPSAQENK